MGWGTYSLETDFFIKESASNAVKAHSSDDTIHVYTLKDVCVCRRGMSENSEWKTLAITEAYLIVNWFDSKSILTGTEKKSRKTNCHSASWEYNLYSKDGFKRSIPKLTNQLFQGTVIKSGKTYFKIHVPIWDTEHHLPCFSRECPDIVTRSYKEWKPTHNSVYIWG